MFSYEFKKNSNATLTSGISAAATTGNTSDFAETDPIDLTSKRHDGKNYSLYIDVPTTDSPSQTSGYLDFYIAGGHASGTTFAIPQGSGTSLIIKNTATGTSQGAAVRYKKFLPLSMYITSGVTEWLSGIPYITLGSRATWHKGSGASTINFNAWLMVG